MLALHTSSPAVPGLTMQQPPGKQLRPSSVSTAVANKPLIAGASPQLIPMATAVPQSQFFIRGGYTLLPPLATPLANVNVEGASFGGLAPMHSIGGFTTRPVTAIPYYPPPPTEIYHQRVAGVTVAEETGNPGLRVSSTLSQSVESVSRAASSPPPLTSLPPSHTSARSPVDETSVSLPNSHKTSLPSSLDLSSSSSLRSPAGGACSPALATAATTPSNTPQTSMPHLISVVKSPLDSGQQHDRDTVTMPTTATPTSSDVKQESVGTADNAELTCSRPKSADAVAKETTSFSGGGNPYPINALIDVPVSLARGSRTSSLSSSISSFRFGGSLNRIWASQLSLSNKVNMKSTGNLNAEAATMPSLGNQYFALGGSLPELSLTSLTRLLPNSSADSSSVSQPGLFTLVHHPTPLYVYSSQQHLATPFINPHGSITFGSFLSPGSSLCSTAAKPSSPVERVESDEDDDDCTAVKKEEKGRAPVVDERLHLATTGGDSSVTPEMKMAAAYSPITAHMIQPAGHTLNRALPVMTLPTFGTLTTRNIGTLPQAAAGGCSPHHPSIIPHLTPYTPSVITSASSTSSPGTSSHLSSSSPHIMTAPPSTLDLSSKAAAVSVSPSSQLSPSLSSSSAGVVGHSPVSPLHTSTAASTSSLDSKMGLLRPVGVPPTHHSEVYLGGPSAINGVHLQPKVEGVVERGALTPPTSEEALLGQQGVIKREKDKPYKCDHPGCERSFSFPAHLRSHIQQIHISYRPCKCEFPGCGKRFYTPQHLNVHRRVHTGERPFVCPYTECCKAFTTAGNLKNHIRTHTGERPYACKFEGCMKRFAEMSSLKKHELTHTGEKPYKCRVCGKAFSQAGSRNTHERKHSRAEGDEMVTDGKVGRRYRIKRIPAPSTFNTNQN